MKKLLFIPLIVLMSPSVWSFQVWRSSTPVSATTGTEVRKLCESTQRGILHGVCTDFGVAAASTTIVNSTWTLTGVTTIGPISTFVVDQCKYFDAITTSGLGYNKPNTATVTILYECQ